MKRYNFDITSLPGEIWKDIIEWKGNLIAPCYQVSNFGRIKHTGRIIEQRNRYGAYLHEYKPHMLNLSDDPDGYLISSISTDDGRHISIRMHQVVAYYFLGKPQEGQTQVNHIDGNKHNNTATNLEWCTPLENNLHARRAGLNRPGKSQAKRCKFEEWNTVFFSKAEASLATGHSSNYVNDCERLGTQMKDKVTGQELHLKYM